MLIDLIPMAAIVIALALLMICIGIVSMIVAVLEPRRVRVLGGVLIVCLIASTVISCAYALFLPASYEPVTQDCLGAPYERC